MNKKGDLGNTVINWFVAMILVFGIIIGYALWLQPWQSIDNALSPMAVSLPTSNGHNYLEIQQQARNQQSLVPYLLVGGVILIAVFASIRPDPNYPQQ